MRNEYRLPLGICGTLLLVLWLIPDILAESMLFPFQLLARSTGSELVARSAQPVAGAMLLLAFLLGIRSRPRGLIALFAAFFCAGIPLVVGTMILPVDQSIALLASAAIVGLCVVLQIHLRQVLLAELLCASCAVAMLAIVAYGFFLGKIPAGYLVPLKDPLVIWAGMRSAVAGICLLGQR